MHKILDFLDSKYEFEINSEDLQFLEFKLKQFESMGHNSNEGLFFCLYNGGNEFSHSGQHRAALLFYMQAFKIDSTNQSSVSALKNGGNVARGLKYFDLAKALYEKGYSISKDPVFLKLINKAEIRTTEGVPGMDESENSYTNDGKVQMDVKTKEAIYCFNKGLASFKEGNYKETITHLNNSIELNPKIAPIFVLKANAFEKLKDYDNAISNLAKSIELDSHFVDAYNLRGRIYMETNKYEKAISDFAFIIEINPSYEFAYQNRGLAYMELGKFQKSIADFNEYLKLVGDTDSNANIVRDLIIGMGSVPKY